MEIGNISQNQFVDLFGDTTPTTTLPLEDDFLTQITTVPEDVDQTTTETTMPEDVDILGENKKPGRKPKYDFSDMSGYFEDRIKAGKFVPVEEDTAEGKKLFIPKTPEEFDEVIDLQISHKIEEERRKLEQSWYQSKSPAWKMIS